MCCAASLLSNKKRLTFLIPTSQEAVQPTLQFLVFRVIFKFLDLGPDGVQLDLKVGSGKLTFL
jgi:hypothetical protein